MAVLQEIGRRATVHYLVWEANGYRAREEIVVSSGAGILPAGTILGRRTRGAQAAPASAPLASNTGNGTLGTASIDAGVTAGVYAIRFDTATTFRVFDPGGVEVGRGSTGVAFNGPINFTVTAGGTPFVAGDGFNFTVSYAAGSLEWVAATEAATDGSNVAAGILFLEVDATSADVRAVAHVRDCEVQRAELVFAGSPTNNYKEACYAALAAQGIAFR